MVNSKNLNVYIQMMMLARGVVEHYKTDIRYDFERMRDGKSKAGLYFVLHRQCGSECATWEELQNTLSQGYLRIKHHLDQGSFRALYMVRVPDPWGVETKGEIEMIAPSTLREVMETAKTPTFKRLISRRGESQLYSVDKLTYDDRKWFVYNHGDIVHEEWLFI